MKKAVAVALIKDNSVLFQLRDNKTVIMPKHWGLPSGRVEKNETLKQTITRELEEETGYQLKNPILFTTDSYIENGIRVKNHLFYEIYDDKQKISCFEGEKMEFKSVDNLKRNRVVPQHIEYAQKAIEIAK